MKTQTHLIITILFCILFLTGTAQFQNGSFEFWSGPYAPDGWTSYEQIIPPIQGTGLLEKDTIDKRDYNASVKLTSKYVALASDTVPGILALGTGFFTGTQPEFYGTPFTQRPDSLFFSYKYQPVGNDTASVQIALSTAGVYILAATILLPPTNGAWADMVINLSNYYGGVSIPDTLRLAFTTNWMPSSIRAGSVLHVDAVSLTGNSCTIAQVDGRMFIDANQNHVLDVGEMPARNQMVVLDNNHSAITNQNGFYYLGVAPGTYTLHPQATGVWGSSTIYPDSITVSADSICAIYTGNDFSVIPHPSLCDGVLSLVNNSIPPRPGFYHSMLVRFDNFYSASASSQTINLHYPANQTYASAIPAPSNADTTNHVLSWTTGSLLPGNFWSADAMFHTSPAIPINTLLDYSADISGAGCAGFDTLTVLNQLTVIGSYDPNDKTVSPVGIEPNGRIFPGSGLTYTIRFQNTGTFLAENVTVRDTLSNLVDINTLKVLAASHNYTVEINGREARFKFLNINLPDSNSNEPLSHGYIQYSIKPTQSFTQNSVIQNRADICFDFNAPIRTNTTTNTGDYFLGVVGNKQDLQFSVYPNPATNQLFIETATPVTEINIYNTTGTLVSQTKQSQNKSIDISQLATGVYIAEVKTKEVSVRRRWVKM